MSKKRTPMTELTGRGVNEGVENGVGGTMMTGDGIEFYKLLQIRMGLHMQRDGIHWHSRLPRATTIARKQLGIKGNLDKLIAQVDAMVERIQSERAADAGGGRC